MGYITGISTIRIISADLYGLLDAICGSGICIHNTRICSEVEAEITVSGADLRTVEEICRKRGDTLQILQKKGLMQRIKTIFRRPVLSGAIFLYVCLTLMIPTRVLFVRVTGNTSIPERRILEAAENCGVAFGTSRRAVRSERIKNALLEELPELQWVGVNTSGCVAEISVRERSREEPEAEKGEFGHIAAAADGIILSCNATRGNLICAPGQAVAAGDILILGLTDCSLTIRAEQAEGEIFAATKRNLTVVSPISCFSAMEDGTQKKKISLIIGKKRINLWKDSGFWDTTCDRMYEENYITLPGGFRLPIGWCVERFRFRNIQTVETQPRELLCGYAAQYLKSRFVALTIRDSKILFTEKGGILRMAGEYSCEEMIGIRKRLEIGEIHGKDNGKDRQR